MIRIHAFIFACKIKEGHKLWLDTKIVLKKIIKVEIFESGAIHSAS